MYLETQKEKNLDKAQMPEIDNDLTVAADLLYEIINHSYQCSGTCLQTKIHDQAFDIQSLYWNCREKLEEIIKGGDKTAFLGISVLEDTFNRVLPLLLVPVEEIASGNMRQADCVKQLKKMFEGNEYKELWSRKAEKYRSLIGKLGLELEYADYTNLTLIMEPLLDALNFYKGKNHKYPPKVYEVRSGKRGKTNPEVMTTVCKFTSEKEFVDAVMGCEKESVIAFGAVEKTNRQVKDYYYEYIYKKPEAFIRNYSRNQNKTEDEMLDEGNEWSKAVYLGVKSAETMWLVKMPYNTENGYIKCKDLSDRYYYGKRAGYAPYEVFFEDIVAEPEGTTFLAVKRNGFRLNDIMDDQQKIWFPVFLEETINRFFRQEVKAETLYLPEEMTAYAGANEIVPVYSGLSSVKTLSYNIPGPESFFAEECILTLIRFFGIKVEDIKDAPIIPSEYMTKEAALRKMEERAKGAYIKKIADCIAGLITETTKDAVRTMTVQYMFDHREEIVKRAKQGLYDSFTEILVDGMTGEDRYGREIVVHPCVYDYKRTNWYPEMERRYSLPYIIWNGERSTRAGVILKIRPKTGKDYAVFLEMKKDELPDILRLSGEISFFAKKYAGQTAYRNSTVYCADTIFLPEMANVNICMRKKEYKNFKEKK